MRSLVCRAFGDIDRLAIEHLDSVPLGPGRVRVATHVASLGFMDILMAQGLYQLKPQLPYSPGACGAGEVVEVGAGVTSVKPGDRVSFLNYFGAFADEIATAEDTLVVLPAHMSYEQAAAYRLTYNPAYLALVVRAGLQPGETLLVTGATGGVGMAATRLGKVLGARVIAAVGSHEKMQAARDNGADDVICIADSRLRDAVKDLTNGHGADVILDVVGGDVFDECIRCINVLGRLIVMGFTSGRIPSLPVNLALLKNCSILGVFFGGWGMGRNHAEVKKLNDALLALAAGGRLPMHISRRFPLEQAVDAMHALLGRQTVGKIVLTMR